MNKKLRYGLLALLAFVGLTVNAQGVEFDIFNDYASLFGISGLSDGTSTDGDIPAGGVSATKEGFTITVSAATGSTPNRFWKGNSGRLRLYSGTLTVSGSGIKTIEFIYANNYALSTSSEDGELKDHVWVGDADEVVFVARKTFLDKIVINGNAEAPEEVEDDLDHGTEDDPISVAAAIHAAEVVGSKKSQNDFYVAGTISSIEVDDNKIPYTYSRVLEDGKYANEATYYISDDKGNEFEVFRGKYFEGQSWKEGLADIEVGDKVLVCGKITNYQGAVPEFVSGESHLVLLNGKGYEEPVVVPTITNVTVEEFLAEAEGSDSWYRLSGMVMNLKDDNEFGNFDLKDKTGIVYVYGVLTEEGGDSGHFQELVEQYGIKNGGIITIVGHRGKQNGNPAVKNAYFEDYEAGSDPETFEVNVADALDVVSGLFDNEKSFDYYAVTGYVVGEPSYERKDEDQSLYGNVNLEIADTKGGTNTLTIFRAKSLENELFTEETLDLFYEGDLVTFYGKLQNYVKTDKETGEKEEPKFELVEGYLVKASASLDVPASGRASFCSAYPIVIENQNVYIVSQVSTDKALLQKVESGIIESGTGLLVEGSGTVNFAYAYGERGTAPEGNLLKGALKDTELTNGQAYILNGGKFYLCTAGTFPGRKAYLPANLVPAGAKIITISDETTGINEMNAQDSTNEIYTIGGIRVKNVQQKGIYIINGKKVVK